ncbi:23S rRNA (cytosine(1962)-C(5))-methyltransferase [Olea europaea subsp. europaea]|uniref:23S rRNA (Cytosine(1962)-C(5))-methyltransferase n=1 Tax=Olea europaea subsp. europaea TaxID=158383 RepID=A0A8S0RPG3_OLEEU|nr:23S rRNA (cytosine(1962)-C(5))-methyltransferase [Olea europaea subsp. europaea]
MVRNATSVAMLDATSCLHLLMQIAFFDLQFHYIPKLSLVGISFLSKSIDYFHALPFLCFFIFCCRLSGLIVDIFGDEAVVASSAAWVEKYKQKIKDCIGRINNINNVTWRPSTEILKEEGLDFSDSAFVESSNSSRMVKVVENGISYLISLEGQKTGFYADQRDNRKLISSISEGQKILDIFCYTGGFALNAACGGALSVTGVDSSLPALEIANENIVLNGLDPGRISFLRQDATEFMKNAITKGESWDIVILDPPKLAPRRKVLQSASGMYRNLNSLAMQITRRGGLLMTCSCSGAMTQSGTFLRVLQARYLPFFLD